MATPAEREFLAAHRAHDPAELIRRWRRVAKRSGLAMSAFAKQGGYELFSLRSRRPPDGARQVYLSAGVHGDEPGGALGLLHWAEHNPAALKAHDVLLFPCLNPWGLAENRREDSRGRDLNRLFQSRAAPFAAWRRELGSGRFDLAISLHEDFDARGCYIYELGKGVHAERLLAAAARYLPPDPRRRIDHSMARGGVIRPRALSAETFPLAGLPEAVWLYFERCGESLTLETPSEFSLYDRVRAHAAMLNAALK